jgi:hypothetical protein
LDLQSESAIKHLATSPDASNRTLRFGIGMQPAGAGQRFNTGEVNVLAAFAAKASLE